MEILNGFNYLANSAVYEDMCGYKQSSFCLRYKRANIFAFIISNEGFDKTRALPI